MGKNEASGFNVAMAGLGGGGILTAGRLLIRACISKYQHVSLSPNYAGSMRGGESECMVVISNEAIASPLIGRPQAAIIFHPMMIKRFEDRVQPGGMMLVENSVSQDKVRRDDLKVFYIPAIKTANELGSSQVANLVMLGAYLEITGVVPLEQLDEVLEKQLAGGRRAHLLPLNKGALREGARLVRSSQA